MVTIITSGQSNVVFALNSNGDNSIGINAASDGTTVWKVESKNLTGVSYGSYKNGPVGKGPGRLRIAQGKSDTYTHSISGNYSSKSNVGASFGVTFGRTYSKTVSYSVDVPRGKVYRIKYRPYYNTYKVVERAYTRIDGKNIRTNSTKTSYVKIFQNWYYSYDVLK